MRRTVWGIAALVLAVASVILVRPAAAAEVDIEFNGTFSPNPATAHVGDDIGWCNGTSSNITVHFQDGSFDTDPIPPDQCDGFSAVADDIGTYTYECSSCADPKPTGTLTIEAATTTTTTSPAATTTTVGGTTTTTARRTTTTARRTTATTRSPATTTTSEETTTTFFDTTTSEETTTTVASLPIKEDNKSGSAGTFVLLAAAVAVLGGGGYMLWRYRYRFVR